MLNRVEETVFERFGLFAEGRGYYGCFSRFEYYLSKVATFIDSYHSPKIH